MRHYSRFSHPALQRERLFPSAARRWVCQPNSGSISQNRGSQKQIPRPLRKMTWAVDVLPIIYQVVQSAFPHSTALTWVVVAVSAPVKSEPGNDKQRLIQCQRILVSEVQLWSVYTLHRNWHFLRKHLRIWWGRTVKDRSKPIGSRGEGNPMSATKKQQWMRQPARLNWWRGSNFHPHKGI